MPTGKVTKRTVEAIAAGPKDVFLWDEGLRGFGLKVTPAGARSYVYQFRLGGREAPTRRHTIGKHGSPWTPATARVEAERLALMVGQGIDPSAANKERRRQAVDLEFGSYAARFLAAHVQGDRPRSYEFATNAVRLHLEPALRGKALSSIKRTDVVALFDKLPPASLALRRNVFSVLIPSPDNHDA